MVDERAVDAFLLLFASGIRKSQSELGLLEDQILFAIDDVLRKVDEIPSPRHRLKTQIGPADRAKIRLWAKKLKYLLKNPGPQPSP